MVDRENEEYEKYKDKDDSKWQSVSKQVHPVHILLFLLIIFAIQYLVVSKKINSTYLIMIIIGSIILILFLLYRNTGEKKLIPEHIIKRIAQEALEKKQLKGIEIPFDWDVRVDLAGESKYEQDLISGTSGIIKREVGFEIVKKGYKKKGIISIDPYTGHIMGLRWTLLGYSGKETKDIKIVPVSILDDMRKKPQKI